MTFADPFSSWFPDAAFDGSYRFDLSALRAVEPAPPPARFAERWHQWRAAAASVAAEPAVLDEFDRDGRRVRLIEHTAVDGVRLRAWMAEPLDRPARIGIVHGHGYGGRDDVDFTRVPADAAVIFPVARGLGALNAGVGAPLLREAHVLGGVDDPDLFVLGLCARDLWLVADALSELAGPLPLYYVGESFGGGVGALSIPWDSRYIGATLVVPSFGQYDERLAVSCLGSGEIMRRYIQQHPEDRTSLTWFDASSAALFCRIPVRVEAARWDQYVPPPGQFAVANGFADLDLHVLPAGHAEYPGDVAATAEAVRGGQAHLARVRASADAHVDTLDT